MKQMELDTKLYCKILCTRNDHTKTSLITNRGITFKILLLTSFNKFNSFINISVERKKCD